jgi:hypothetical protein
MTNNEEFRQPSSSSYFVLGTSYFFPPRLRLPAARQARGPIYYVYQDQLRLRLLAAKASSAGHPILPFDPLINKAF